MTLSDLLEAADLHDPSARRDAMNACLTRYPAAALLIRGPVPARLIPIGTLRDWVTQETGLPPWLIDAARKATGDLSETLALLLPCRDTAGEPDLSDLLADLRDLPPGPLARNAIMLRARCLPDPARLAYFQLLTGGFLPLAPRDAAKADIARAHPTHEVLAVMIYAEATLGAGARGPEITLAVWDDGALRPIARARTDLSEAQTASLMAWIRANVTQRFGPLRAVPGQQVFRLGFSGLTPNRRRKSGITLADPVILGWYPETDPDKAGRLADLTTRLANTA